MRHLEICCYPPIPLVNLNVKNKTTYKSLVESSLQVGKGEKRMRAAKQQLVENKEEGSGV